MDIVRPPSAAPPPAEAAPSKPQEPPKPAANMLSWSAPEYPFVAKAREWYWAISILTVSLVVVAALIRNFLFAILVVLAGFTVALYSARRPRTIRFAVTARGIEIGEKLYPYESLESFWIRYEPPAIKELDIISKKLTTPRIAIPLGDANPVAIRESLSKVMKEVETEETFAEMLGRYFGF